MSTYDDLLRQVESLRQVNSSLQREIQDNNAQLSRLQESSTHLVQIAACSSPQLPRSQAGSAPLVSRPQVGSAPQVSRAQVGSIPQVSMPQGGTNPVNRPSNIQVPHSAAILHTDRPIGNQQLPHLLQQNSAHNILRQPDGNSAPIRLQENAANQMSNLSNAARPAPDSQNTGMDSGQGEDFSFNEDLMEGEHMATLDEGTDLSDCQPAQIDPAANGDDLEETEQGQGQGETGENIIQHLQQLDHERTSLVQQIESEEKNRKWYYDQIEMISRKIRSLPVTDGHPGRQPGFTRKHLEMEIARLRETMHESFGTNEHIVQRRDSRVHRIRQIEAEMVAMQQQRQQLMQEGNGQGRVRHQSSSDSAHSGSPIDLDNDQVTMATQTDDSPSDAQHDKMGLGSAVPGSIYHGTWPIGKDDNNQAGNGGHHGDLSSVMSFNSTNTSSSHGSGSGAKGQGQTAQGQGQARSSQGQQPQPIPVPLTSQIPPQQLGTKVEMVYGLLSMLGTHDKDDMSRTLLAMSSSQDSCIAMRQSGCLPLLIQLLHGSDKDSALLGNTRGSKAARARASASLHNIVHSHPDDKRGRREARVLRLLEQIRAHCDQLRENSSDDEDEDVKHGHQALSMDHHPGPAIATLMKLSFDEEHRHAICTLGGLHAIAELLQVDNDVYQDTSEQYNITMRRYACMALTNLTFGDGTNKSLLCSLKDSMEALVLQLLSSNEELCQVAASVLRNLSWKADLASKKTLREVGAVTTLMQASMRVQKETTLKSILSALWNLSAHCSENKADICAVIGALEFLISSLTYKSPSKTTAIIENGGGILRNVSSHIAVREDYRQILRVHGCLQILLKHLRSPSLTIVSNACGTLWNLSARCAEDQQALWEMGAVGMLRNLVHSKHKMISMGSSAALKNLLAARPAMKNIEMNKQANNNRPSLHVRKQRALESEIDQNLAETCENVESPRDSPVETKKQDGSHFVYTVYPLMDGEQRRQILRGPVMPRSQSGDNALYENHLKMQQGVARSGSQDSVGSTHSDISHDRSRHASGGKGGARAHSNMGGSLDRHKEGLQLGQRVQFEGRTERNPLGAPNSRILQVMHEVLHAGIDGETHDTGNDSAVFKTPLPPSSSRSQTHAALQQQQQQAQSSQQLQYQSAQPHSSLPAHIINAQHAAAYQRLVMSNLPQNQSAQFGIQNAMLQNQRLHQQNREGANGEDDDEKPLDYSMKYHEGGPVGARDPRLGHPPHPPMIGNYVGNQQMPPCSVQHHYNKSGKNMYYTGQQPSNKQFNFNSAYAETDLDDPDQPTDFSARYGAEYNTEQYNDERMNYDARYGDSDPNCADCKLEEARRYNDRLDQVTEDDQIKTFCTEDTPYLSTATSLTDLSAAMKILEEAEEHCPPDENDDETQNYSSKYGENGAVDARSDDQRSRLDQNSRHEGDMSSRSGSNATDILTGTTVIANYHLKCDRRSLESNSRDSEEPQERSFHDNKNDDAPYDQPKTYCEEGTPVCFSRVSSLSSLHSSEAADRQDPSKRPVGPLESIDEHGNISSSIMKMPPPPMTPNTFRQKHDDHNCDSSEKEHKTVKFDDKEQVQETPMMFSRCTSLGSLSSFDTQSVHSSVFSEYSRRASEVVSPSELPDSPSETMPPSPRRTKSPERNPDRKPVNQELFPPNRPIVQDLYARGIPTSLPQQFTSKVNDSAQRVNPLARFMVLDPRDKMMDYETGSSKSEAPVVYAEEGTPPIFHDNLSELSCITSDNYNINEKTLVETPKSRSSQESSSHSNKVNEKSRSHSGNSSVAGMNSTLVEDKNKLVVRDSGKVDTNQAKVDSIPENNQSKDGKVSDKAKLDKSEDKGLSSNSDVSEGEDDLLANIISSAMPISSKKMRKSSSDNAIKRKSNSSSRGDSGSSSRSSKTPAKSGQPVDTGSKSSSGHSSAKKSLKLDNKSSEVSPENKVKPAGQTASRSQGEGPKGQGSQGSSPGKTKSQIPRPFQHKQVQQMSQLDCSIDSTTSSAMEESPFNTSNAQSVIARSAQKPKPPKPNPVSMSNASPSPLILEKARHLSNYEHEEEGCRTYATEDTPFSGSMQASPQMSRKFEPQIPDSNMDTVKSFATEDTPFSGSAPGSPKPTRQQHFQEEFDNETDSIKCFNTEDTPFSGSAFGSPKANRKQVPTQLPQTQNVAVPRKPEVHPQNQMIPKQQNVPSNVSHQQPGPRNQFQQAGNQSSTNASGFPLHHQFGNQSMSNAVIRPQLNNQSVNNAQGLPQIHPQFNPHLFGYGQNEFDCDDVVKTYATEGTPLNYSRTGSFSDLSSLNANFDEKVKITEKATASKEENPKEAMPAPADECLSDNSSSLEESEDLLSELINSAMPSPKSGKSRRSIDRKPEGAESKNSSRNNQSLTNDKSRKPSESVIPTNFQPQRTSSLTQDNGSIARLQSYSDTTDQVKTYAVEGTPLMSQTGSLSDLTIDTSQPTNKTNNKGRKSLPSSVNDASLGTSGAETNYSHTATFGTSNDSVFLHSDGVGDSLRVYITEGTPQSFSCNESLSSLSIMTDDSKNEIAQQVKALANHLVQDVKVDANPTTDAIQPNSSNMKGNKPSEVPNMGAVPARPESRSSVNSSTSMQSTKGLERHVVGQSSEDQSVTDEPVPRNHTDETKKYNVEDTPLCFSVSSSLSSINDAGTDGHIEKHTGPSINRKHVPNSVNNKHASKDEHAGYKVEHTPICFSRNSSLSSLSVVSDDDDDPDELALLEDCISSALPPRTRPTREELRHNSHSSRGSSSSKSSKQAYKRNAHSSDELERSGGEHDSRYSNWRQQPHKSSDEIFRKPTLDAKGRPCRRSRSQDSEKHYKDISNQQLARYGSADRRGSWDSGAMQQGGFTSYDTNMEQRQQLISETQNIVSQVQKMTRSVEKGDDRSSEKTDSPASDYNFFMTCSGNTEISVENISKESFPSSMAPDTDDDILNDSLVGSYRFGADGDENGGEASQNVTLTERNVVGSHENTSIGVSNKVQGMTASITSEDERALAENANIVMSEMINQMVLSGTSTVDEENFIENETLSLVSNGYLSDTASEASNTWSVGSDFPSEGSGSRANGNGKRPRILKPGDVSETVKNTDEVKGVRGKRKPLYSNKSVSSPTPPPPVATVKPQKVRTPGTGASGVGKVSPRQVLGSSSPSNNQSISGKKSLRTMPQASSTPVKNSPVQQKNRNSPPQRSSSLDQRGAQNSRLSHGNRSSSTNRNESANRSDSSNRSASSNQSGLGNRSNNSSNRSQSNNSPSKIQMKNAKQSNDGKNMSEKPRTISKQGTFIKESTNRNAPVISPEEKNKENVATVRMRQRNLNDSSNVNRNSSGSSKSNYSNTSNNSNSFSTTSSDSPPDSWSKALSTYSFNSEQTPNSKKDSKLKKTGTTGLKKSAKTTNTKIPSPCKPGLNKSGSGQSLRSSSSRDKVSKSSSGMSLTSVSSGIVKAGSHNSLKQNSRPSTPVNKGRKGSSGSETGKMDKENKKGVTSKIAGLWKSEGKEKGKTEKKSNISKLPIAMGKPKSKDNKKKDKILKEEAVKRESSPKPNVNRNTYILDESKVEGINRSSTYDKLDATNDKSQIPTYDNATEGSLRKSMSGSSNESKSAKQIRSIFDDNELNKTCRDFSAFEIGVEYNLDDAWASNVEKSIEVMSKSIEESKNRIDSFYDDTVDTSKMDLTASPAKRLSKSGSMSEIELEFGRIHSGTWTKKKSHNDYATLPHAEDSSRTLPLVKRSESLNFSANLSVSHYDYDESQEVWIRRDDKLRSSDISGMKKKKGFKGSSGFLNAVSKMFGGGSKKSSDKQSKSMIVMEKDNKKMNESSVKNSKKENKLNKSEMKLNKSEAKMNKSETKLSKAEQKQLKAELKAQAKLNKSELKASKKESKLIKSLKNEKKYEPDDNLSQTLSSSTSSLKRSAEYLIDIDKSDDEDDASSMHHVRMCPRTPDASRVKNQTNDLSASVNIDKSTVPYSKNTKQAKASNNVNQSENLDKSIANGLNKSVKGSPPSPHLTKTEMLLARRQAQLNSSSERSESDEETTSTGGRKRSIVTTV